jgi:hypothetical protein
MIFFQRPEDFLTACQTWATSMDQYFNVFNAFLAVFGLGSPTLQNICLGIYDFLLNFAKLNPFWPYQNFS